MYIASAGIFNGLSTFGTESESYCVIDRSIHFEVKQSSIETDKFIYQRLIKVIDGSMKYTDKELFKVL